MNHRQRVLAALNHQEPDRVPVDIGATRNTSLLIETNQALAEFIKPETQQKNQEDFGQSKIARVVSPSEDVLRLLDVDFRGLFLGKPNRPLESMLPDGSHKDELGVIRQRPTNSYYYDIVFSPFDREMTVTDLKNWTWPDPSDPGYIRGLREKALALRQATDYALVLHLQDIIIHPSQYLRGFQRWYTDFLMEPDLLKSLLDILTELRTELAVAALREVGDLVDVVSSSDDIADQRGPMISPTMYRQFIKPRHQRYFDALRAHTNAKILYHSCGSVVSLIPDFLDIGVDFINPVQVSAAKMDTSQLKKSFGDQIGFWGAIDTMHVLPFGTQEQVRAEVRQRIRDLAPGGGYVLAAVHNIQPNVSPQNIVAMVEAAHEFGTYPIEEAQ
jgi:uroporphyrinogen decarboxylase